MKSRYCSFHKDACLELTCGQPEILDMYSEIKIELMKKTATMGNIGKNRINESYKRGAKERVTMYKSYTFIKFFNKIK